MSWWTENRKKVLPALGLLGLNAIPGVGQAASAGLGSLTGGLLGGTEGALTAATVPGLTSFGPGSQAAMLAAQNEGLGASALGMTANAASGAEGLNPLSQMAGKAAGGLLSGSVNPQMAMAGMNMMQGQQQPPMMAPPPRPQPMQQGPTPFAGYGMAPPPGVDPIRWSQLTDEQKRMMMGRMG